MPHLSESIVQGASASTRTIALVADTNDWHARTLGKAFAALGAQVLLLKLPACGFDTAKAHGLCLPDFELRLPDAVLVRDMSGGTFEAVTLRLGILHALQEVGVPVWNAARSIERCVDKSATSFLLARAGLPTPMTWATQSREAAAEVVRRETGPFVLKPLFGSQGRGLRLVRGEQDLPDPADVAGVYYLQRFVGVEREGFRDFRVLVSSGRVVAALDCVGPVFCRNANPRHHGWRYAGVVPRGTARKRANRRCGHWRGLATRGGTTSFPRMDRFRYTRRRVARCTAQGIGRGASSIGRNTGLAGREFLWSPNGSVTPLTA